MSDALKIVVERAVRPLAASRTVKRRIREDLYALICDIHREESARGNDASALERTLARFGPPEELTRELQQSLSWLDRGEYWLNHWVERRPEESPLGLALRVTLVMSAWIALLMLAAMAVQFFTGSRRALWPAGLFAVTTWLGVGAFVISWLAAHAWSILRHVDRGAWRSPSAWLHGIAGGSAVALAGLVVLAVVSRGQLPGPEALRIWGAIGGATTVFMVGVLQAAQWEYRSVAEWEELDLAGDAG